MAKQGEQPVSKVPFHFETAEAEYKFNFVEVDKWFPLPSQVLFTNITGAILCPVSKYYGYYEGRNDLDYFSTSAKKCYNSVLMRDHTCLYLNYFEAFYDQDKEYFSLLSQLKYLVDYRTDYVKQQFIYDLRRYILSPSLLDKTKKMVKDNYSLDLQYKNINNPSLQYTDEHAQLLIQISLLMNMCIPLLTHFAYSRKIKEIDNFLLEVFDIIFGLFGTDIYNKLYETSVTNISKSQQSNPIIWAKQDIRGKNVTTHSQSSVNNIILNIMPKYIFSQNVVSMNYSSILNNTGFQVLDIEYEFSYIPLSSSKRDEDNQSDFDKFESGLIKSNEAAYLQCKISAYETMKTIESIYGPFDQEEIDFYLEEFKGDTSINGFQKQLVFLLFYKYFGDTVSINAINKEDYIKLIIAAKQILLNNYMVVLPYIISGKVDKLIGRKSVNKKELVKLEMSPNYDMVVNKYKNDKIIKLILSYIATIISSEFHIIDYHNPEINGKKIEIIPDMIIEEILMYTILI